MMPTKKKDAYSAYMKRFEQWEEAGSPNSHPHWNNLESYELLLSYIQSLNPEDSINLGNGYGFPAEITIFNPWYQDPSIAFDFEESRFNVFRWSDVISPNFISYSIGPNATSEIDLLGRKILDGLRDLVVRKYGLRK